MDHGPVTRVSLLDGFSLQLEECGADSAPDLPHAVQRLFADVGPQQAGNRRSCRPP